LRPLTFPIACCIWRTPFGDFLGNASVSSWRLACEFIPPRTPFLRCTQSFVCSFRLPLPPPLWLFPPRTIVMYLFCCVVSASRGNPTFFFLLYCSGFPLHIFFATKQVEKPLFLKCPVFSFPFFAVFVTASVLGPLFVFVSGPPSFPRAGPSRAKLV